MKKSKTLLDEFIYAVRKSLIQKRLERWKSKHKRLYPEAMQKIHPEFRDFAASLYIRRSVQASSSMFVDIYWYIKRSEHSHHMDYVYYRCDWTNTKYIINSVELKELPEHINTMIVEQFQKDKQEQEQEQEMNQKQK